MHRPPNLLILMADQMQAQVLEPDHICRTPHLDQLAQRGVRFTRAYTPNNICSPSRASLMTGLMPHNHGVLEVLYPKVPDLHILRDKPHFAQRLVEAGYRTGYFGKWHIERTNQLNHFGWQVDGGHAGQFFREAEAELLGGEPLRPPCEPAHRLDEPAGYGPHMLYGITDRPAETRSMGITTTMALHFLEEATAGAAPWCCFLSFVEPHDPFITHRDVYHSYATADLPPPPNADDNLNDRPGLYRRAQGIWRQLTEEQKREARACYYASITEIDAQFGRVLDALAASGQAENTIVVMMSDHGDLLGAHGLFFKDISAFEEIYRLPFIVSGPGVAEGIQCRARVGLHDLCPTLLDLAGCAPFDVPDSRSFAHLLADPDAVTPDWMRGYAEYFGNRHRLTQRIVWDGPWKFVFNGFDFDELYNLEEDPWELVNLAQDPGCQGQLQYMMALYWHYARTTGDTPLAETLYPALRLGVIGPLWSEQATTLEESDRDYRR